MTTIFKRITRAMSGDIVNAQRCLVSTCAVTAMCAALCNDSALAADAGRTVIIPDAIVAPDGNLTLGRAIVIEDGRIIAVESADDFANADPGDVTVVRRPGTIISPGLIDLGSGLGVYGDRTSRFDPVDPAISVVDGFDPADPSLAAALQHGITAALIVPSANNLVAGSAAVIRTAAPDGSTGDEAMVLRAEGPLVVSLGAPVLALDRAPTSRAGALSMLRNTFDAARANRAHPRINEARRGERDLLVIAERAEDVTAAYRFFETYGLVPIIMHRGNLFDVVDDIVEAGAPVIAGPYSFASSTEELLEAGRLTEAGTAVGFAGGLPAADRDALRTTAALAVRYGMDAAAARRGLTATAAAIAGVDDAIGSIAPGLSADLVVFSADPLQLHARVLEVYVAGHRAWVAPAVSSGVWADAHDLETDTEAPDTGEPDDVEGE